MRQFVITFIFCVLSASSYSSNYSGKISRVLMGPIYGSTVIIDVEGTPSDRDACHTNSGYDFAFDGSTEEGKMYLSTILTAYASKMNVNISGYSSCTVYGGIENLFHILLQNN